MKSSLLEHFKQRSPLTEIQEIQSVFKSMPNSLASLRDFHSPLFYDLLIVLLQGPAEVLNKKAQMLMDLVTLLRKSQLDSQIHHIYPLLIPLPIECIEVVLSKLTEEVNKYVYTNPKPDCLDDFVKSKITFWMDANTPEANEDYSAIAFSVSATIPC